MPRAVGWILDDADRARLLERFPPRYAKLIAHHVTLWSHKAAKPVPGPASFNVVGHADDGRGIEALVVTCDGKTQRPDGSTYHITWSLDPDSGLAPKHSNDLIAEAGWAPVEPAIPFSAEPGLL